MGYSVYRAARQNAWRVIVRTGGRRLERIVEGPKAEAAAYGASTLLAMRSVDSPAGRAGLTFADFCTRHYQPHAERHLRRRTWRESRRYHVERLCELLGHARIATLSTAAVEAYKAQRQRDGMRPRTVNSELMTLSAIMTLARHLGIAASKPAIKVLPTPGQSRARAFTVDELSRLFNACDGEARWLTPLVVFAVNTGLRPGEVIAAEWSWIDLGERLLRMPTSEAWSPKSGKAREVPLGDAAVAALGIPRSSGALFPSRYGTPRHQWPAKHWQRAVKAAGLRGGPHQLRHTFASHFLAAGGTMFDLGRILGQSNQRTTELYAHLVPGHMSLLRNIVNIAPGMKTVGAAVAAG
jgi:integrase